MLFPYHSPFPIFLMVQVGSPLSLRNALISGWATINPSSPLLSQVTLALLYTAIRNVPLIVDPKLIVSSFISFVISSICFPTSACLSLNSASILSSASFTSTGICFIQSSFRPLKYSRLVSIAICNNDNLFSFSVISIILLLVFHYHIQLVLHWSLH